MSLRDDIFTNNTDTSAFVEREPLVLRDPVIVNEAVDLGFSDSGFSAASGELDNFHTTQPEDEEPSNTPKIIGALAVALMLGTAGAYVYMSSGSHPQTVTAAKLPENPPAQQTAAVTPPPAAAPSQDFAMPSDGTSPKSNVKSAANDAVPVKASEDAGKIAKPKRSHVARADIATPSPAIPAPEQTAAVPEPVNPPVPANSMAANSAAQPQAPAEAVTPVVPVDQAAPAPTPADQASAPEVAAAQPVPAVTAPTVPTQAPAATPVTPAPAQAPTVQDNQAAPAPAPQP